MMKETCYTLAEIHADEIEGKHLYILKRAAQHLVQRDDNGVWTYESHLADGATIWFNDTLGMRVKVIIDQDGRRRVVSHHTIPTPFFD